MAKSNLKYRHVSLLNEYRVRKVAAPMTHVLKLLEFFLQRSRIGTQARFTSNEQIN